MRTEVSSTYWITLPYDPRHRTLSSAIKMYKAGPSVPPCDTPDESTLKEDSTSTPFSVSFTFCDLLVRYETNHSLTTPRKPIRSSFDNNTAMFTVSKARLISKESIMQHMPFSKPS
ncbi:uncharacterized protein LOC123310553 [Coccinella septempunctata]|uniref:uncharacterized protein LOC123310553 n=1 Tax=Coccinella septempunctata TaxID=41139 RepID=UPI001D09854E|nr:uncharacterized protein LOC123310553 [Coccinella septempunctata]